MALEVSKAVWYKRLPEVNASKIPMYAIVPHEAVAWSKVISAEVVDAPLLGAPKVADLRA